MLLLAKAALKRAVELDPNLPETYLLAADVALSFDWDWAAAGANYRKAIELSPGNDVGHRDSLRAKQRFLGGVTTELK